MRTSTPLNPQSSRLSYSVRRYLVDDFLFRQVSQLPAGSKVIDVGGLKSRKRGQFNVDKFKLQTIYVNLSTQHHPDVQGDAAALPFQTQMFDAAICTELLEHVCNPETVLRDAYRVLNRKGKLIITVPFLYPIHGDPHDFGRYTDRYWLSVLEEIGFEEIAIERQGLYFSVLANFLKLYANRMYRRPIRNLVSLPLALFQQWALKREQNPSIQSHPFLNSFTTGFGITATKV